MGINDKIFTIPEIKEILKAAYDDDYDVHGGRVSFYPVTIVEWRESDVYKEELVLCQCDGTMLESKVSNCPGGYFGGYKTIFGFLDRWQVYEKMLTIGEALAWYVKMVFHELWHYYDDIKRATISNVLADYDTFVYDVEQFVLACIPQFYDEHHDSFMLEINANTYGIKRALSFLENKGLLTPEGEELLRDFKNKQMFLSNNFDIHDFFKEVHSIMNEDVNISKPYLDLFYEDKKATFVSERFIYIREFRDVGEILQLADKMNVDERILMSFFSSKDFLDNEGQSILCTFKYRPVIMRAIEYALEIESNRRKKNEEFLQNKQITLKQYQEADVKICDKIKYLTAKKKTLSLYMSPAFDPDNRRGSFWDDEPFRR